MNTEKEAVAIWKTAILLLAVIFSAAALFLLCYRYDNKYTVKGPQPMGGVLMLDTQDLEKYPVTYLIRDWEIYREKLLTPKDFASDAQFPDELVFIGQYGSFDGRIDEAGNSLSPHGSVTYRLNIALPAETRSYALELPEIYSAYKLYINGTLMMQMGDTGRMGEQQNSFGSAASPIPQSYRPETGNRLVMVQAENRMEILVAVSDYSHFYSGMVYPPAFGEPEAVLSLLNTRFALRAAVSAVALCVGLLYFFLWLFTKKDNENILPLLYCVLCICFVLYTCYPVVKTLWHVGMGFYVIENFAYCAMFLLVMMIQWRVTGTARAVWKPFVAFGIFVCSSALMVPLLLENNLSLILAYSGLIGIYAPICAVFLTISAGYGVWCGKVYSKTMLAGVLVFDTALVMDRLLPMFEPIRFGWFVELAGGVLVLMIGFIMAMEIARQFNQRHAMELEIAESRISIMLSQIQPHFLYNSLTAISNLCVTDPERAEDALNDFSHYLRKNLDSLGSNYLITFENELKHLKHYLKLEKMRFGDNINVVYDLEVKGFVIPPLTIQPLAENAVRYGITKKPGGGTLTIATREIKGSIVITISDDGLGFADNAAPDNTRRHVGIENVKMRLKSQLDATLDIESTVGQGTVCTITIPKEQSI